MSVVRGAGWWDWVDRYARRMFVVRRVVRRRRFLVIRFDVVVGGLGVGVWERRGRK